MNTRHLGPDEIVERVFSADDRPAAVPAHLATCAECQDRVANLREAWLLDRGAVSGAVDDLPSEFWTVQAAATMAAVRSAADAPEGAPVRAFPARARGILRHPALALSSLAAALVLVGGLSLVRSGGTPPAARTAAARPAEKTPFVSSDASDDELLVSVDRALEDSSFAGVVVEETL
jgi:anti-sigma factor RsiW